MIASMLKLSASDVRSLKIKDEYALHKTIYSMFEYSRNDANEHSGILYADKGGEGYKHILILSDREPKNEFGELKIKNVPDSFLLFERYRFEVTINPVYKDSKSGKMIALRNFEDIKDWFLKKSEHSWGFLVNSDSVDIGNISVKQFSKADHNVVLGSANIRGILEVVNREKFIYAFKHGLGRGKAFGFGLLQLVPINT